MNIKYLLGGLGGIAAICIVHLGLFLIWLGKVDSFLAVTAATDLTQAQEIHQIEKDLYSLPKK